jgi:CrcB protein
MSVATWIGVAALGGAGALARFLVDGAVSKRLADELPFGTLLVNASGALVLGTLTGLTLGADASLLLSTALVGSYTTFSTWMLETHRLVEEGEFISGVANVLGSLALGIAMAALGRLIAGGL